MHTVWHKQHPFHPLMPKMMVVCSYDDFTSWKTCKNHIVREETLCWWFSINMMLPQGRRASSLDNLSAYVLFSLHTWKSWVLVKQKRSWYILFYNLPMIFSTRYFGYWPSETISRDSPIITIGWIPRHSSYLILRNRVYGSS